LRGDRRPGLKIVIHAEIIYSLQMIGEKGKGDKKVIESFQKYGYTQRQIAARLNLHFLAISDLMRGKSYPHNKIPDAMSS
jgi:hypothetical protein